MLGWGGEGVGVGGRRGWGEGEKGLGGEGGIEFYHFSRTS